MTSTSSFSDSHIRKDIPSFDVTPYAGERYEDLVPTLSISRSESRWRSTA